jgi:Putative carbonic anhydrase
LACDARCDCTLLVAQLDVPAAREGEVSAIFAMEDNIVPIARSPCSCHTHLLGRRRLLAIGVAAGGATLLARSRRADASGKAKALLLSCIDYRLVEHVDAYMKQRGLEHEYDHVILAGASLGVLLDQKPDWGRTFWDHVDVAKKLHGIEEVIAIDHRDCGAYKVFLGPDSVKDAAAETASHTKMLQKFSTEMKTRHPDLGSELLLMALDGSVQTIAA